MISLGGNDRDASLNYSGVAESTAMDFAVNAANGVAILLTTPK